MTEKAGSAVVPCPRCGKPVAWIPENRFRPFCSERCKQIDLGAWAAGEYRVPVVEDPDRPDAGPAKDQDA
ncbi:MAG TPA: DNA gyrase inhibitor YacG [Rhodocyclaceae bacterium]